MFLCSLGIGRNDILWRDVQDLCDGDRFEKRWSLLQADLLVYVTAVRKYHSGSELVLFLDRWSSSRVHSWSALWSV